MSIGNIGKGGEKVLKKAWMKIKKEALSVITIILLAVYIFISYRTYVIQQERYEIDRQTYELMVHVDELVHRME